MSLSFAVLVILSSLNTNEVTSQTLDAERFDCYPDKNASLNQANCEKRGCIWNTTTIYKNEPLCFYPNDWGYTLSSTNSKSYGKQYVIKQSKYKCPFGQDITTINIDVIYDRNERVRIRMTDPADNNRYTVPIKLPSIPSKQASNPIYSITETRNSGGLFGLKINQIINGESTQIGTTAIPGFVYSNQFIQFMLGFNPKFNTSFGWGERYSDFIIPYNFSTIPGFSRDIHDDISYRNSYGVHPFMINTDISTGNTLGIFIVNSNAMELVTTPYPAIQYRTIGGIIDMFIFFGPKPSDIIEQYWEVIGNPFLPPLWSLGFHLSRCGYNSVNRTRYILEGMVNNTIPYDTQWNDYDYMDKYKDFTYDPIAYKGFPQFVDDVHNTYDMKYIHIVDCGIGNDTNNYPPYTDGVAADAFIKGANGEIIFGQVWPGNTAFPDWFKQSTKEWWGDQAVAWKKVINYDGWWLDMDEPSNLVDGSITGCPTNSSYENPPYYPASLDTPTLYGKTLCMTSIQTYKDSTTTHYNVHSLYGLSEMIGTQYALNQTHGGTQRNFIISRSTYPSAGQYGGHWIGDNDAHYLDMQISITDLIEFNMFGVVMVGTDICGFDGDTTKELCSRWMAVGAFFPFSRNHNTCGAKPQDPPSIDAMTPQTTYVRDISRRYLQVRYQIMPYFYTLFYDAHVNSKTVMRSLWLNDEFYKDPNVYGLVNQFMIGDALLLSPQIEQGKDTIDAYFPPYSRWYEWFTGNELMNKGWITIKTAIPSDDEIDILPIHIGGGCIMTLQDLNGTLTTKQQAVKPYQILVALDVNNSAMGKVCIDDGISIDSISNGKYTLIQYSMEYDETEMKYTLKNSIINNGYTTMKNNGVVNEIKVIGLNGKINKVDSVTIIPTTQYQMLYNVTSGVLTLSQLTLTINKQFTVSFHVVMT